MLDKISSKLVLDQIGAALSTTPMMVKDRDHRFVYVNEAAACILGHPVEELIGKNDLDLGRPRDLVLGDPSTGWPGLWGLDKLAMESDSRTSHAGVGLDSRTNISTERIPLTNDDGEVVGLLVQLHDMGNSHGLTRSPENNRDTLWIQQGETDTVDRVLSSLSTCHDTSTLFNQLVNTIIERTNADGCYLARVHESGEYMEFVSGVGPFTNVFVGARRVRGEGLVGEIWERGEAAFINDLGDKHASLKWEPLTQGFGIPLIVDDVIVAVMLVVSGSNSPDLARDIALLERIARIATFGITNTLLMDSTAKTLSRTRALGDLSRLLNTVDNATDACDAVCRVLLPAIDASRATGFLVDDGGTLHSHVRWASINGELQQVAPLSDDLTRGCIAQWSFDNGQTGIITRGAADPRESKAMHELREQADIGSTCCVPLLQRGKLAGALVIARDHDQLDFDEHDIAVFTGVVNQLSAALDRHELALELRHQAFHDRLTTLPNRHYFEVELTESIEAAQQNESIVTVLFIDLDGFKNVNDKFGHAVGDLLLSLVSERLSRCIQPSDVLARMGGDEFAVIIRGEHTTDTAFSIAQRILSILSSPFSIVGECVSVGASIGVSSYPEDGKTGDDILRCADTAMYQAKHTGKGQILCFDIELANDARDRNKLELELRQAVDNGEFKLLYQPQVRCSDNLVVGVEALIRWEHPTRGTVSPLEFIPLAETIGVINTIGSWVINEAVRQLAQWQKSSLSDMRVSINIAPPQFHLDDFADQVLNALDRHNVPPHLLELEVTEGVVMNDVTRVVQCLYRLREAGVRVAIDDFGTGYSSLSYLQDLPLDVLKIDRTFVTRLVNETGGQSLVKTIQLLASGLGLETVAEGVESQEQLDAVEELGCDLIQGYLHSKPVTPDQIPNAVKDIQSRNDGEEKTSRAA